MHISGCCFISDLALHLPRASPSSDDDDLQGTLGTMIENPRTLRSRSLLILNRTKPQLLPLLFTKPYVPPKNEALSSRRPSTPPPVSMLTPRGGTSLPSMFAKLQTAALYLLKFEEPLLWKEQYFVNVGIDCGLTIVGFYYVCFSSSDGSITGFYYDPNSSLFQKLELKTTNERLAGFTFSSYQLQ
ncbi:hypothetical protein KSP39_PZI001370 [Platanthera zijinensis]|uniref:Uncharacterized protein n=1 Tax=Platanthera zijinensis TaxID=2320716 RepID=A0AAP0GGL4_9ASPA